MLACLVCGSSQFSTLSSAKTLQEECRIRERFIKERTCRPLSPAEQKDLIDFFHQEEAHIVTCDSCGLLVRRKHESPPAETYSEDEYDPSVMEHLYPQYLEAFRRKEKPYRSLLNPGAHVVEVGSHYGAFLQTAQEWGWHAEGVDVGKDTTRFARSKGFTVHNCELADRAYADHSLDGVFIWNCFEQIETPAPVLRESFRILKPGGLLVVRTPNGLFYKLCRQLFDRGDLPLQATEFLVEAMGYNNLLGFPYLYGHSETTLQKLIEPFGFSLAGMLNSELITLPLPENPAWVDREERMITTELRMLSRSVLASQSGVLTGTWVELWFTARQP
jgi:SAM-dependent methyltransferase